MAKVPSAYSISGPDSLRPNAPAAVADMSGLTQGVRNLAGSLQNVVANQQKKQNTIDLANAEAFATKSYLEMQNQFQEDGDYATFTERAESGTQDIAAKASAIIRDPEMRARWAADYETRRAQQVDSIGDIGRQYANEAERVSFGNALTANAELISEPSVPEDIRNKARADMLGTIEVARETGLLTPAEAEAAKTQYLDGAEEQLALNVGDALIRSDPQSVLSGTGIGPDGTPLGDARAAVRIPVVTAPGINLSDVNPVILTRFEQVQSVFGKQLPVISGERTAEHNAEVGGAAGSRHVEDNGGDAIDIDVSALSKEERVAFIETASAMGFAGIGVYANSLHLDTRDKREAWGSSYHSDSIPGWAKDVIGRHTAGAIAEVPVGVARNVDPRFAALSYQQRAALFDQAKRASEQVDMNMRAGIETTAANAPAAIARTGGYDNDLPDANDFVQAYGAQDGIEKFKAFDASVKVAQDSFAMRTMSTDQIAALVEQTTPTSTGDDAALQEEVFARTSAAAAATIKAREEDPSAYVQEVYPAVADAWAAVEEDPAQFGQAVTVTALAQEQLGITQPVLLPKAMATGAAAAFNNLELSDDERLGALTQLVLATPNEEHQVDIYEQLVASGVPETTRGAMDALARGDEGAARRLFQAALTDPDKIDPKPGGRTKSEIDEAVAGLMDTGEIGDIAFDLTYGDAAAFSDAAPKIALMTNSIKMRLLDGTAGGNIQTAVDLTVKDMFGDVKVVKGTSWGTKAGLKALLPKDADEGRYRAGFDALLGQVGEALADDVEADAEAMLGPVEAGTAEKAIREARAANLVEQTLAAGYFTNAGDGQFKFIDPNSGAAILDRSGSTLMFSTDDVLAAGAVQPIAAPTISPAAAAGAAFGSDIQMPGAN